MSTDIGKHVITIRWYRRRKTTVLYASLSIQHRYRYRNITVHCIIAITKSLPPPKDNSSLCIIVLTTLVQPQKIQQSSMCHCHYYVDTTSKTAHCVSLSVRLRIAPKDTWYISLIYVGTAAERRHFIWFCLCWLVLPQKDNSLLCIIVRTMTVPPQNDNSPLCTNVITCVGTDSQDNRLLYITGITTSLPPPK